MELCVYAGHADTVHVCLFDAGDREGASERRIPLTERAHGFWFGHLRGVTPGQRYAVRASGPATPGQVPASVPQPDGAVGLRTLRIVDAARRSVASGQPVDL